MKKILIIDNDRDVLDVMQEALGYEGFDVTIVESTDNINLLVKSVNPHLVIIDYLLGDRNGGELCHEIKSDQATDKLPVILFSAYPRVLNSLGTYGCDAFIPKPFDLDTLLNQVHSLIERSPIYEC